MGRGWEREKVGTSMECSAVVGGGGEFRSLKECPYVRSQRGGGEEGGRDRPRKW